MSHLVLPRPRLQEAKLIMAQGSSFSGRRRLLGQVLLAGFLGGSLVHIQLVAEEPQRDLSRAANPQVAEVMKSFAPRGVQSDGSSPTPPQEAVGRFQPRAGFTLDLVAAEPEISQPLFSTWDSRGRMWVVQYRQYQYPAGLKVVRYDHHLRAVFDKIPDPPPKGTPGLDRITVLEDIDGDGEHDRAKDVITGLNIATSVQLGRGGIWVLNPPYLLFYPDADQDDVPDSDPQIHLSGFGLEDTHAVANSLLWGPDGWLYGANGSTTTGTVSSAVTQGVTFQGQCIWRYHPESKIFEIYAEGGGNTFSLDIDAQGQVFSGTNGGGTRGFYYPQGAYFQKNWGKHGPLTNPYAFGFFEQMKGTGDDRRFPQALLIYDGGLFPSEYDHTVIAPNAMHNLVWHSLLIPDGSYYRTEDQPNLLETPDRWFRPVHAAVGPDGCVYLSDWYDTRLSHVSPIDDWHKESGRIYRFRPSTPYQPYRLGDLTQLSSPALAALFDGSVVPHPNKWVRQRGALELGWRGDHSVVPLLERGVQEHGSLESLWGIHLLGELTNERAVRWLVHEHAAIRRWVVRLLGDRHQGISELATLARDEQDVQVRSQLASTAKRIPTEYALPILVELWRHDGDLHDPHLPLLTWWALEGHATHWSAIEAIFAQESIWKRPIVRQTILERIMQRYAVAGTKTDMEHCARLVELAPDDEARELLLSGLNNAFQGRTVPPLPDSLQQALQQFRLSRGTQGLVLAVRQGDQTQVSVALKTLRDKSVDLGLRVEIAAAFGEIRYPESVDTLLSLATSYDSNAPALQRVAIRSLGLYDDKRIPQQLTQSFDGAISDEHNLRFTACRTLAARKDWALALLAEVNQWRLKKSDLPADVIQQLRTYHDPEVAAAMEEAYGKPVAISSQEKVDEMQRLLNYLSSNLKEQTDLNVERGEEVFMKHCGACHKLFGKGETIGPQLDPYDRGNLTFWLLGTIDPSAEIREGYQSYLAVTDEGRVVTGMMAGEDPQSVTLRTAENQMVVIQRDQIDEFGAIPTSLMPEGLLKQLTDDQLRDLFGYLTLGTRK